jgi:hypothetical protein
MLALFSKKTIRSKWAIYVFFVGKNTNVSSHIQAQNGLLCHGGDMWQIMTNVNLTCNRTVHVISMPCGQPCGPIK